MNPWIALIGIDGKSRYLGSFATKEEAHAAYRAKAEALGRKSQRRRSALSPIVWHGDNRSWKKLELTKGKWA
jgi:hypothetical protein